MKTNELTAEELRQDYYGTTDSRAYDQDELNLMEQYAEAVSKRKVLEALEDVDNELLILNPSDYFKVRSRINKEVKPKYEKV